MGGKTPEWPYLVRANGVKISAVERNCDTCGRAYLARKDQLKVGKGRNCSIACVSKRGGNAAISKYHRQAANAEFRDAAHAEYKRALRRKVVVPAKSCENCGKECKTHGHHMDYLKPLDVKWLCGKCHLDWHMNR